jgi:hypothetical protein
MKQKVRHLFLFLILCILLYGLSLVSCCKKKTIDPYVPGATVWGTLTLPEIADGKPFAVVLDSDTVLTNDYYIYAAEGLCRSATTVPYSFYDTPAGEYYLYGVVWTTSGKWETPRSGDFFGYYGSSSGAPDSANVVVPSSGEAVLSFGLNVFRE